MLQQIPWLLVIDPEMSSFQHLRCLLEPGIHVIQASSAQAALDLLSTATFDLILLDMLMPEMNGWEILERIRSNSETFDVPVILLSTEADEKETLRALTAGADDVLRKPLENDLTLARIHHHLVLKQRHDALKQTVTGLRANQWLLAQRLQIVAHDLNKQLMNIRLAATLLETNIDSIQGGADLLSMVNSSIDKMGTAMTELLPSS